MKISEIVRWRDLVEYMNDRSSYSGSIESFRFHNGPIEIYWNNIMLNRTPTIRRLTEEEIPVYLLELVVGDDCGAGVVWMNTTTNKLEMWDGNQRVIIAED